MDSIIIKIFPRIHITLIGMDEHGYRRHGGIGFSISKPNIIIKGRENDVLIIQDLRNEKLSSIEYRRLQDSILEYARRNRFEKSISIQIKGELLSHYGYGSETALRLACLEMLCLINKHPINKNEIIIASGRGGVSGIGINTYFNGGFIIDLGIKNIKQEFQPSNLRETRNRIPLLLMNIPCPNWELGLFISSKIKTKTELEEKIFFNEKCPIKSNDVINILYHSIYGCTSAILENDKDNFAKAIYNIQSTKWKMYERELYDSQITSCENILLKCGANSVGMSSLGPLLFFFSSNKITSYKDIIFPTDISGMS